MTHCPHCSTRRDFLRDAAFGIGAMAVTQLLARENRLLGADDDNARTSDDTARGLAGLHHLATAKQVINIFLGGGLSQVDSFDYKPELEKYHGKEIPESFGEIDPFFGKLGLLHKSHFEFKQRGKSGLWMSDLFPGLTEVADELTVINSMVAETANHIPGIFQANTGFRQMGFPAMGAWLSYALGTENDDLPSFVVLPDSRGIPNAAGGAFNWTNGFLPAEHQGVPVDAGRATPILDLKPSDGVDRETERDRLALLKSLNELHLAEQAETDPLVARIHSYELAARMQRAIPEAMDMAGEPEHMQKQYGLDRDESRGVGQNCLAARRLVERGVRFVQIWTGDGVSWDAHEDIRGTGYKSHLGEALRVDRPIAGLIADLRQRGLLDTTVVMISTEFGRTPYAQSDRGTLNRGRDHHPFGFSNVLAGGGLKGGIAYGATDAIGYSSVENVVTTYDLHATVLHLLGIDHTKLTFYHNGIGRRLTNVHGHVVKDIIA
jgi:hypothetical protein